MHSIELIHFFDSTRREILWNSVSRTSFSVFSGSFQPAGPGIQQLPPESQIIDKLSFF